MLEKIFFHAGLYAVGTSLVALLVILELGMCIINEVMSMKYVGKKFATILVYMQLEPAL